MQIRTTTSPEDLARVHTEVLQPSFPPDELADVGVLQDLLAAGQLEVVVAERHGTLLGAALAEWSAGTGILLLAHLAVAPGARGGGVGGAVLDHAMDLWRTELDPWLVLAEVEDPAVHAATPDHGDPVARLRFYRQRGARVLPLPYVQPAMRPGGRRVPGLLLLALCASGDRLAGVEADGTWLVPTAPVRAFLESYFASSEGAPPSGPDWDALVAALEPPVLRV
jgi:GNAT superfamily N-acetyltransferase